MALSEPLKLFGEHSITFLDYSTKVPRKTVKIPAETTLPFQADVEVLYGGSNKLAWEIEPKYVKPEGTLQFKQFDGDLFQWLCNATYATTTVAGTPTPSTTGVISTPVNVKGTSMFSAAGMIAPTITTNKNSDLKEGLYVVEAASSSTYNVYVTTDYDFIAGSQTYILDDTMKIVSAQAMATGVAQAIANFGLTITGGGSATSLTPGDTCTFEVTPAYYEESTVTMGQSGIIFPKFSCVISAARKGTGDLWRVYAPKVLVAGFDTPLKEYSYATASAKLYFLYSYADDFVWKAKEVKRYAP
jgi:hypothetical protein